MSASTDLRALLAGNAGVAALVGTRISSDRMEQGGALPAIVFSGQADPVLTLAGTATDTPWTFEVQCWATTRASAEAVADAVQTACNAAHQTVTGRAGGYDGDLDLEVAILTVSWWDD